MDHCNGLNRKSLAAFVGAVAAPVHGKFLNYYIALPSVSIFLFHSLFLSLVFHRRFVFIFSFVSFRFQVHVASVIVCFELLTEFCISFSALIPMPAHVQKKKNKRAKW